MLVCPIAASAPKTIDTMEMISMISRQEPSRWPNGSDSVRRNSPTAATFGAVAKNSVTGVGEPS